MKEGDVDLWERRKANLMRLITGLLIIKRPEYHWGYIGVCTLTTSLYSYDTPERTWPVENSLLEFDTPWWQSGWQWFGLPVRGRYSSRSWEVVPSTLTVRWCAAPLADSSRSLHITQAQHSFVVIFSVIITTTLLQTLYKWVRVCVHLKRLKCIRQEKSVFDTKK